MTGKPLISVITVVRNAERHIAGCLASVKNQDAAGVEHWVVDGASTDHTVQILQDNSEPRLHWLSEPDKGVFDAMNKAVRLVSGDWILFLGADDRLRPGVLKRMSDHLADPHTVYYGDVWMTGTRTVYGGRFSRFRLARKNICHQAIFYPRTVFDAHLFDLSYPIQADWVFNMACRQDAGFRFQHVPLLVTDYDNHSGLSSRLRDLAIERNYVTLLHRYFPPSIAWPWSAVVLGGRWLKRMLGVRPIPGEPE